MDSLSDHQLLGIDRRCQSACEQVEEFGKLFKSCQLSSLDYRLFFIAKITLLYYKLIHVVSVMIFAMGLLTLCSRIVRHQV